MPPLIKKPIPIPASRGHGNPPSDAGEPTGWTLAAPAKLNLFLEVLGKRDDGYHGLETVMVPLRLADRLTLFNRRAEDDAIRLTVIGPLARANRDNPIPVDGRNLVVQALEQLQRHTGEKRGANLVLEKHIPAGAGLGGGSSDAAAALLLANHAWGLGLREADLNTIAARVGSDVPFFLRGGSAICRGRGELIEPAPPLAGQALVVAKPAFGLSTAAVYHQVAESLPSAKDARSADPLLSAMAGGDWRGVAAQQFNRLEGAAIKVAEPLKQVEVSLRRAADAPWMMTGSGSAFFALTPNHLAAQRVAARVRQRGVSWAVGTLVA